MSRKTTSDAIRDTIHRFHDQEFRGADVVLAHGARPVAYDGKTWNSFIHSVIQRGIQAGVIEKTTYGYRLTNPPVERPRDYFNVVRNRNLRPLRMKARRALRPLIVPIRSATMAQAVAYLMRFQRMSLEDAEMVAELELPNLNREWAEKWGVEYPDDGSLEYPERRRPGKQVSFF